MATLLIAMQMNVFAIEVTDDTGKIVRLDKPASRIITLAPHLTEMLFAVNQGERIVATVSYSDYPKQALKIPRLGSYDKLNVESVLAYQPDLILAWHEGNNQEQLLRMESLGLTVYRDNPRTLQDVAKTLRNIGLLTGSDTFEKVTSEYLQKLDTVRKKYQGRQRLTVFYQFWDRPIYTINGDHFINEVLQLCGLKNVFAGISQLSATVDREAVLKANPQVVIAASMQGVHDKWLDEWRGWGDMQAVKYNNLFTVNPDWLHRHTPRILLAAEQVCQHAEQARLNLGKK